MNGCISYVIQQKAKDFQQTIKQFFNKKRKSKIGRPKFKRRKDRNDSIRIPCQTIGYHKGFLFDENQVKIPKIGLVKIKFHKKFDDKPLSMTIRRTPSNQFYLSVCVEEQKPRPLPKTNKDVGIDLGIRDLCILSNGQKFENPKYYVSMQKKLRSAQKHLSRKTRGSRRYEKQRLKVARIHQKIVKQRDWYYHQISNYLVKNFDDIYVETLKPSNMKRNRKMAKAVSDVSWNSLIEKITYKCDWYDKSINKIGRWYPSSKTCNCCGFKLDELSLDIREWTCPSCNTSHDRDLNASINILKQGLYENHGVLSAELPEYSRGEDVRPKDFLQRKEFGKLLQSDDFTLNGNLLYS